MKKQVFMILTAFYFFYPSFLGGVAQALPKTKPFRVVLDPGHGGADEGTVFEQGPKKVTEKETTLMIARQVALELKKRKILATLTRSDDRDVPLGDRTAIANKIGADLFVSIHMNSAPHAPAFSQKTSFETRGEAKSDAQGIETYILNNTTDESSRRLARLENTVLGPRDRDSASENMDVALILRDLKLDANLAESKRLACTIQSHLITQVSKRYRTVKNRGVKQALFHVLLGAEMPSVLIEAGFLSHDQDRGFILSLEGKKAVGSAIAQAIQEFHHVKGTRDALSALSRCKVN